MVDFKRLMIAKRLVIECDGFVKSIHACNAEATCYFESENASYPEYDEEDCTREHYLCSACFRKLFPNATVNDVEEAKEHMLKHKYKIAP